MIGAYAQTVDFARSGDRPLARLDSLFAETVPPRALVHLLPIYPSAGDWGFAPNDWFTVRPEVGTWDDVLRIASKRHLMIDGVYNHVGLGHPYAEEFLRRPREGGNVIYAYRGAELRECPVSPRGGPVLRLHTVEGERWYIWQTFSDYAVDIRLDDERVTADIERHLDMFRQYHVWGVRLDAPAYYAKHLGQRQRHHPNAYRLARRVADMAIARGLAVMAQLDCDSWGVRYYPLADGYDIPIVDYAYSAHLARALWTADVSDLAAHVENTWSLPCAVIRAPRTHDGILLRSHLLPERARAAILRFATEHGVPARVIGGSPYELNCSFPYLCSLGVSPEAMRDRIDLAITISAILPGMCYLYLPMLIGYMPEEGIERSSLDPRTMNRVPMPESVYLTFVRSERRHAMLAFLDRLIDIQESFVAREPFDPDCVRVIGRSLLLLQRAGARLRFAGNFDPEHGVDLGGGEKGELVLGRGLSKSRVEPLGFGIWRY